MSDDAPLRRYRLSGHLSRSPFAPGLYLADTRFFTLIEDHDFAAATELCDDAAAAVLLSASQHYRLVAGLIAAAFDILPALDWVLVNFDIGATRFPPILLDPRVVLVDRSEEALDRLIGSARGDVLHITDGIRREGMDRRDNSIVIDLFSRAAPVEALARIAERANLLQHLEATHWSETAPPCSAEASRRDRPAT